MKKRVFSFDKGINDKDVQEFIEIRREADGDLADDWVEFMRKRDGEPVKMYNTCTGNMGGHLIHVDWTEEIEVQTWKETFLMGAGIGLAIYGLAMLCVTLADMLKELL